ncbi:MAG: iron-sulfur cluster assembly protein, partial [Actinomycetota bacterium]
MGGDDGAVPRAPGGDVVTADTVTPVLTDLTATVRAAAAAVEDPEMPPVTIGQLGMVHDVTVEGARARVEVIPTFSGCPA